MDYDPYLPQETPVPVGDGLWTVEGPVVAYKAGLFTVPCPTRATVLADPAGGLWIHSPIRYSATLMRALSKLGPVRGLIAPNSFHHLHLEHWATAYPGAACLTAPGLEAKLAGADRSRLDPALDHPLLAGWLDADLIDGGAWCELVFHHRASKTLVFTDLIQNFELQRVRGMVPRLLLRLAGAGRGPVVSGEMLVMALFAGCYGQVRKSLRGLNRYDPANVLIAHGLQPDLERCVSLLRRQSVPEP